MQNYLATQEQILKYNEGLQQWAGGQLGGGPMGVGLYQPSPALMQFLGDPEPFSM